MDSMQQLIRKWANQDGLTALHITAEFDERDEPLRLWWFFLGDKRISPGEGLCDDSTISFLKGKGNLSKYDQMLLEASRRELNNDDF